MMALQCSLLYRTDRQIFGPRRYVVTARYQAKCEYTLHRSDICYLPGLHLQVAQSASKILLLCKAPAPTTLSFHQPVGLDSIAGYDCHERYSNGPQVLARA
jgi:hypothetical protein